MSQEQMAETLNISRSIISSWEIKRIEIRLDDSVIISYYFDASIDNLFNPKSLNSNEFKGILKFY